MGEQSHAANEVRISDTVDTESGWLLAPREDQIRLQTGKSALEAYGKKAVRFLRSNWTTDRSPLMRDMHLEDAMDFTGDGMDEWGDANVLPYLVESLSRPWHEQQDVVLPYLGNTAGGEGAMRLRSTEINRNIGLSHERLQARIAIQADARFRARRRRREQQREEEAKVKKHFRLGQLHATNSHADHMALLT